MLHIFFYRILQYSDHSFSCDKLTCTSCDSGGYFSTSSETGATGPFRISLLRIMYVFSINSLMSFWSLGFFFNCDKIAFLVVSAVASFCPSGKDGTSDQTSVLSWVFLIYFQRLEWTSQIHLQASSSLATFSFCC